MTPEFWLGVLAILVTLVIAIGGALLRHAVNDAKDKGEIRTEIKHIKDSLGTHETGMRGDLHEHGQALTWLGGCVWYVANKLGIELPKRERK